jgi:hypothetical protein
MELSNKLAVVGGQEDQKNGCRLTSRIKVSMLLRSFEQ